MRKLLFSATAAVVLMSACKKDGEAAAGSFTYNGATANTGYGFYTRSEGTSVVISFASYNAASADLSSLNGNMNTVTIALDTLMAGSYTYYAPSGNVAYDPTKHFYAAQVYRNFSLNNPTGGNYSDAVIAGTFSLEGTIPEVNVSYSLDFGTDIKVVGKFKGKLTELAND
jgi:hypothetical protein